MSFTGADQTSGCRTATGATGSSSAPSLSGISSASGDILADFVFTYNSGPGSPGADQTSRVNDSTKAMSTKPSGGASQSMSWSQSNTYWLYSAASVIPAAGASVRELALLGVGF